MRRAGDLLPGPRRPGGTQAVRVSCALSKRRVRRRSRFVVFFTQTHHPGRLARIGFHPHDKSGRDDRRASVRSYGLSFRSHLLELGDSLDLLLGELREPERWVAASAVGAGRSASTSSHGSDELGCKQCFSNKKEFTARYQALMDHYGLEIEKINARQAHENGDVEQSHNRFKEAVDQALLLRGSRDFVNRAAYARFLREIRGPAQCRAPDAVRRGTGRTPPAPCGTAGELQASAGSGPFRQHHSMWTETRIRSTAG